jgi:hypothetical protein
MSCKEMKELQLRYEKYVERRSKTEQPAKERRSIPTGHRAVQARIAYLMLAHRQTCILCSLPS